MALFTNFQMKLTKMANQCCILLEMSQKSGVFAKFSMHRSSFLWPLTDHILAQSVVPGSYFGWSIVREPVELG